MKSEVEGALSLAFKYLPKIKNRSGEKYVKKVRKHFARIAKYGGPNIYLIKDGSKREWRVICDWGHILQN